MKNTSYLILLKAKVRFPPFFLWVWCQFDHRNPLSGRSLMRPISSISAPNVRVRGAGRGGCGGGEGGGRKPFPARTVVAPLIARSKNSSFLFRANWRRPRIIVFLTNAVQIFFVFEEFVDSFIKELSHSRWGDSEFDLTFLLHVLLALKLLR